MLSWEVLKLSTATKRDRPMNRMVSAIVSLAQHLHAIRHTPQDYRPAACPHCGLGRLWRHGCYVRKADRRSPSVQSLHPIPIPRYCCAGCGHTCSRLPGCLAPRRWYDWAMQQRALLAVLRGLSLRRCAAWTGLARQTVRRWQAWLAGRHEVFAFHLRSRFGELGRAGELAEFWQTCWRSVSLADAMTWLNRVMVVP